MKYLISFAVVVLLGFSALAESPSRIVFSPRELEAAFTLTRPELNSIEIDGRTGTLNPSPALRYLGVEASTFDINMGAIANLVDLEFNHIRSKPFQVVFQEQGMQITLPLFDQNKAVRSNLGSIHFKEISLIGVFVVQARANGQQSLTLKEITLTGQMSGTGVLKSKLIMKKTKALLVTLLTQEFNKLLSKSDIQESFIEGLLTWSKFYTGNDYKSLVPGSIVMDQSGIHYESQY